MKIAFCLHGLIGTTDKYGLEKREAPCASERNTSSSLDLFQRPRSRILRCV